MTIVGYFMMIVKYSCHVKFITVVLMDVRILELKVIGFRDKVINR